MMSRRSGLNTGKRAARRLECAVADVIDATNDVCFFSIAELKVIVAGLGLACSHTDEWDEEENGECPDFQAARKTVNNQLNRRMASVRRMKPGR